MKKSLFALVAFCALALPALATGKVYPPDHPPNCPTGAANECTAPAERSGVPEASLPPRRCKQEAKVCPDGRTVARTGPNCEFAACPAVAEPTCVIIEGKTVNGKFTTSREELPKATAEKRYEELTKKKLGAGQLVGMRCEPQ